MTKTEREAKAARDQRIVKWTRLGSKGDVNETARWDDQVWWGYWNEAGNDDESHPPDALFPTEEQARGYAAMIGKQWDTDVAPVVLTLEARDNFQVPA